jgi:hypothetical protein
VAIIRIPVPGLAGPSAVTPERVAGSVRRTSHVDVVRITPGWEGKVAVSGRARDLVTPAAGPAFPAGAAALRIEAEGMGSPVTTITSDPDAPALAGVTGTPLLAGFRRAAVRAVPEEAAATTPLYRLLDDAPLAYLVSGHALMLDDPPAPNAGAAEAGGGRRRHPTADLCAGWQTGGTLLSLLEENGSLPHSLGPEAPELMVGEDPLAWHDRPVLPARATRRTRRLDVVAGTDDEPVRLDVHFRDSYADLDGVERSLHEYTLSAEFDPHSGVVLAAAAVPHALPWTECPQAAGSVERLVGLDLRELPGLVRREFTGITTCTHLNDTMRSLADAWAVLSLLNRG